MYTHLYDTAVKVGREKNCLGGDAVACPAKNKVKACSSKQFLVGASVQQLGQLQRSKVFEFRMPVHLHGPGVWKTATRHFSLLTPPDNELALNENHSIKVVVYVSKA